MRGRITLPPRSPVDSTAVVRRRESRQQMYEDKRTVERRTRKPRAMAME
uniref:Uncharacterized protein n=1 Tax=Arabidopsis thaliana TaxID=3702 RepID=Q56Y07_ARATH|nr:hypothetical protein [Arabidopsis thaliana]